MSRTRRRFTSEQKAQIVRRHLASKEPVSALAEEFGDTFYLLYNELEPHRID